MEDDAQDDYDAYWHARDHHAKAQNITVPVLYAQGWEDGNVATTGFPLLWANLTHSPEKRIWLEQHGHGVPANKTAYHEYVHRWLDYWLLGRDDGALSLPPVVIEDNLGKFHAEATWPPADAAPQRLFLAPAGKLDAAPPQEGTVSWTDTGTGQEDPMTEGIDHVTFATAPLAAPMHVSGTPAIHLVANGNLPGGQIDVKVYDQAPDGSRAAVSRGFLDARHRGSLDQGVDLTPGADALFAFDLHPIDWRLQAGHSLVVVVKSTDDYVVRSPYRTAWTMKLGANASWLDVPTVPEGARHYADAAPAPWTG
jgi:X-Pro dipeptidyl-peptidase